MALKKVYIDMDEGWKWWVPGEEGWFKPYNFEQHPKTVEINEEWLRRAKEISDQYHKMQIVLEHLYRVQEGLEPWTLNEEDAQELTEAMKL